MGIGIGIGLGVTIAVIAMVAIATRRRQNTNPAVVEAGGIYNNYLPAMYPCWSLCLCILNVCLYNVSTDISMSNN